ncbi:RHS repeat domain-containing protein [Pseudomonas gingeri]
MDFNEKDLVSIVVKDKFLTKRPSILSRAIKAIIPIGILIASSGAMADSEGTNGSNPRFQSFISGSQEPDQIDPRNGNLVIHTRDFKLPGNGGLDIEVWRRYDMRSASSGLVSTHSLSYQWAAMGPGWTISAAPKISARYWSFYLAGNNPDIVATPNSLDDLCNIKTAPLGTKYKPVLQQPNGDVEEIFTGDNQLAYTRSNWKISCAGGHLTAVSPKGVVFDFGLYSERHLGVSMSALSQAENDDKFLPLPTETYFLAKTATDLSGNTLTYRYQQFGTPITNWAYNTQPGEASYRYQAYASDGFTTNQVIEASVYLLSSVTSSDGRSVNFTYDPTTKKVLTVKDGAGHQWTYAYLKGDSNNSATLIKATSPTGEAWGYEYSPGAFSDVSFNKGRMVPVLPRKLIKTTNPVGGTATYTYGSYQYSDKRTSGSGGVIAYQQGEQVTSRTLDNGNTWRYSYARGGAGVLDTTTVTAPDGVYTYKIMGVAYSMRLQASIPSPSEYQNNAWQIGQLISITDPLGNSEQYTWGNRVLTPSLYYVRDTGTVWDLYSWAPLMTSKTIKRDGSTFSTVYSDFDAYGNPKTVVENGPNSTPRTTTYTYYNDPVKWVIGLKQNESSPAKNISRVYNVLGQLTSESINGANTSYGYDAQGSVSSKTMPRGGVYTYTEYKRGVPQVELRPDGSVIKRAVDESGNVTSITDASGNVTEYTFDGSNRATSEKRPLGNIKYTNYTPAVKTVTRGGLVEITALDQQMNVKSVSVNGVVVNYLYDPYRRKIFESQAGSSLGTAYKYDVYGRVIEVKNSDNSVQTISFGNGVRSIKDELGNTTSFSYKAYGSPEETYLMGITSPISTKNVSITRNSKDLVSSVSQAGVLRKYEYNEAGYLVSSLNPETGISKFNRDVEGNIVSKQVGNSNVTTFSYNLLGWLEQARYGADPEPVVYKYEGSGKVISVVKGVYSRGFKYDANLNLISDTAISATGSFETLYSFDSNDRMSSITYPYTREVVNYTNDSFGRPIRIEGFVDSVAYWPSGMIKQISYSNGTSTSYEQNSRLWPSAFKTGSLTSPAAYANSTYGYDASGNLLSVVDTVDPTMNRSNSYDAARQIVGSDGPWGKGSFSYDGAGNLTSQILGFEATNYQYNSSNLLSGISGENVASYSYDAYGNVINSTRNDFTYDDVPNMQCANCASSSRKVTYYYDPMNMRSGYEKLGVLVSEVRDNSGRILGERDPSANTFKAFIYLGDKRIADKLTP